MFGACDKFDKSSIALKCIIGGSLVLRQGSALFLLLCVIGDMVLAQNVEKDTLVFVL